MALELIFKKNKSKAKLTMRIRGGAPELEFKIVMPRESPLPTAKRYAEMYKEKKEFLKKLSDLLTAILEGEGYNIQAKSFAHSTAWLELDEEGDKNE